LICTNVLLASLYENFISASSIKESLKKDLNKKLSVSSSGSVENLINLKVFNSFQRVAISSPAKSSKSKRSVVEKLFNFRFYERSLNNFITVNNNEEKFIMKLRGKLVYFFHYNDYWLTFLHSIILINIIILSLDRYPIDESMSETLELLDFLIFIIYFFEICLKLIVFGPLLYFKSGFNIIDFIIVVLNALEYIYQAVKLNDETQIPHDFMQFLTTNSLFGNFIKTIKVIRLFRSMFYSELFRTFALLLNGLVGSLYQLKYFSVILIALTLLISLIGKEIFAYRIKFIEEDGPNLVANLNDDGFEPKINYDTIGDSLIGTITGLYNEEWQIAMFQLYIGLGYKSLLFYYPLIIFGQMTCITLFSALFLNAFIKYIKKKMMNVDNFKSLSLNNFKVSVQAYIKKFGKIFEKKRHSSRFPHPPHYENRASVLFGNAFKSGDYLKKVRDSHFQRISMLNSLPIKHSPPSSRKSGIEIRSPHAPDKSGYKCEMLNENEMFFFKNRVSEFFGEILGHRYFENFMQLMTIASMVDLALDTPITDPDSNEIKVLEVLENIFISMYILEFVLKVMIFGAFTGKKSYFQDSFYNFLDFINVILSIASLFENKRLHRNLHMCKIIRCFRVIKFARVMNKDMQILSNALVHAFPNIMKLLLFLVVFLFIFSIFSMKYLKGIMYECDNLTMEEKNIEQLIQTKFDCFDYGGNWINHDLNYDNIINAFVSLFQIVSGEGWSILM